MPEVQNFEIIVFNLIVIVIYVEMFQSLTNLFQFGLVTELNVEKRKGVQNNHLHQDMILVFKGCLVLNIKKQVSVIK
jgi:hypothetical protein